MSGAVVEPTLVLRSPPAWDRLVARGVPRAAAVPVRVSDADPRSAAAVDDAARRRSTAGSVCCSASSSSTERTTCACSRRSIDSATWSTTSRAPRCAKRWSSPRSSRWSAIATASRCACPTTRAWRQYLGRTALTAPDARHPRGGARAVPPRSTRRRSSELAAEVLPGGTGSLDADGRAPVGGSAVRRPLGGARDHLPVRRDGRADARRDGAASRTRRLPGLRAHRARDAARAAACRRATSRAICSARARRTRGSRRCSRIPTSRARCASLPYDPTHRVVPGLNYITVAVGRDYADIAPTSGTFQGASGHFTARKNAWIVELA